MDRTRNKTTRIRPLPGKALIQLEPYWEGMTGGLVVSDSARARRRTIGKVLRVTPRNILSCWIRDTALLDNRVLFKPYVGGYVFEYDGEKHLCIIKIEDILAILPDRARVTADDGAVPRCKFCGPAKSENSSNAMFLVESAHGWYCPRCLRGVNGQIIDPEKAVVSEGEVAQMQDRIDRAKEAELMAKGGEPKRKIISMGALQSLEMPPRTSSVLAQDDQHQPPG